jgi:hypothetical protein
MRICEDSPTSKVRIRRVTSVATSAAGSNICSDPGNLCSRGGWFLSGVTRRLDGVNVRS